MSRLAIATVLCLATPSWLASEAREENSRALQRPLRKEDLLRKIREYVDPGGGPGSSRWWETATLRVVGQDKTPSLRSYVIGRRVWHLSVPRSEFDAILGLKADDFEHAQIFDVYVDERTGVLSRIVSRWPTNEPLLPPMPSSPADEAQMWRSSRQKYHGFPDALPKVGLQAAFRAILNEGIADPYAAKQIVAQYVLYSRLEGEPQPVWAVTLWGIPSICVSQHVAQNACNHARFAVSATTGEVVAAGSAPQPEIDIPAVGDPYWEVDWRVTSSPPDLAVEE